MTNASSGFILLKRNYRNHPLWRTEPFGRGQAWLDLILMANHSDSSYRIRGHVVTIKRGQIGRSEEYLAKTWGWSRGKVRRFLSGLEIANEIKIHRHRIINIIEVVNYDDFLQGNDPNNSPGKSPKNLQGQKGGRTDIFDSKKPETNHVSDTFGLSNKHQPKSASQESSESQVNNPNDTQKICQNGTHTIKKIKDYYIKESIILTDNTKENFQSDFSSTFEDDFGLPKTLSENPSEKPLAQTQTSEQPQPQSKPLAQPELKSQPQPQPQRPTLHVVETPAKPEPQPLLPKKPRVRSRNKTQESLPEIPTFLDSKLWQDFVDQRKAKRRTLTRLAAKMILERLGRFEQEQPGSANTSLEQSVMGCWSGVYPVRQLTPKHDYRQKQSRNYSFSSHTFNNRPTKFSSNREIFELIQKGYRPC